MLERIFALRDHGTNVRTELIAGLTTFLSMVYIILVNPSMLAEAGMDHGAVFVATCLAAALGSLLMGLFANYPIALAPGMGLNAYFTYSVVLGMGHPWQTALGAVFLSGVLFSALSLLGIREWIINAIPTSLKLAICAGVGFFLGIIALKNAGVIVSHPATLVTLGDLGRPETLLACLGFIIMTSLGARKVPGGIVITILAITSCGVLSGLTPLQGIVSLPPSLAPTFLQLDISGAMEVGVLTIVFAFLFVDLFDTAGTLIGVAHQGGMLDKDGRLPRIGRALLADSSASVAGAALGTSTTTSYIESALGIQAGGRTGLTAVTVALLFIAALFFAPLAATVPGFATAPALLYVACMMARGLAEINWEDTTEGVPAVITALAMPLTFSIATGIGMGFISYVTIKILAGRPRELSPASALLAGMFVLKFILV
ncbi:MAG: NCS2 family permease [Myxococcota bacterium]|nr:NCS2 family permease [Myxococcota bacterium]